MSNSFDDMSKAQSETVVLRKKDHGKQIDTVRNTTGGKNTTTDKTKSKLDTPDCEAPKKVTKALQDTIRDARTSKKLTQKQLAQQASIDVKVVQSYENGSAIPTQKELQAIRKVLGVNLSNKKQPKKTVKTVTTKNKKR